MKTKAVGVVAVVAVVAVKVLLKVGVGVGVGAGVAQAEIEASKFDAWTPRMHQEVVASCVKSAGNAEGAAIFCDCYATAIEKAHVIPLKFNSLTSSEADYEREVGNLTDSYLESAEGKAALDRCANLARG